MTLLMQKPQFNGKETSFLIRGGVFAGVYIDGRPRYSSTSPGARYSGRNGAHFTMPLTGTNRNTFVDIANGIFVNNANSRIIDSDFRNIVETSYPVPVGWQAVDQYAGYGIRFLDGVGSRTLNAGTGTINAANVRTNSFNFVDKGIYAGSYSRGTQALVRNNTMINMGTGINVVGDLIQISANNWLSGNFSNILVSDNQITTVANSIRPDDAISITDRVELATRTVVSQNIITLNGAASEFDAIGIAFWGNGGNNGLVPSIMSGNTITLNQGEAGIKINNTERLSVNSNNQVFVRGQSTTSGFPSGIRMEGARRSIIDCNSVTYLSEVPIGNSIQNGLYLNDNPRMKVSLNTMTGGNVLAFIEGSSPESDINQNNFIPISNAFTGLFYGSDPAGSGNSPAFTGAQVDKNNRWLLDKFSSGFGGINWLYNAANNDGYYVPGNSGTLPYHPHVDDMNWFLEDPNLVGNDCYCGVPCNPVDPCGDCLIAPANQPFFIRLANDAIGSNIPSGTKHQLRYFLFDVLAKDPVLRNSNLSFEQFFNQEIDSDLGLLHKAKQRLAEGQLDSQTWADMEENSLAIESKQNEIDLLIGQIELDPNNVVLLNSLSNKQDEFVSLLGVIEAFWSSSVTGENQAINDALELLNSIQTADGSIQKEAFVLKSALQPETIDAATWTELDNIANDCATEAGDAVYLARTLCYQHSGTYPSHPVCTAAKNRSFEQPTLGLALTPNPAQEQFSVTLTSDAQIYLFDILGRLVQTQIGKSGKNLLIANVKQSGMYQVKVVYVDGTTNAGRIFLNKTK
jgi:hypothetical protein